MESSDHNAEEEAAESRARGIATLCIAISFIYYLLLNVPGLTNTAFGGVLREEWVAAVATKAWIIGIIALLIEIPLHKATRDQFAAMISDTTGRSTEHLQNTATTKLVDAVIAARIQHIIFAHSAMLHAKAVHEIDAIIAQDGDSVSAQITETILFEGSDKDETAQCYVPFDNSTAEIHAVTSPAYNYATEDAIETVGLHGNEACFPVVIQKLKWTGLRMKYEHPSTSIGGQLRFNGQPIFADRVTIICHLPKTLDVHLLGVAYGAKANEKMKGDTTKVITVEGAFPRHGLNIEVRNRIRVASRVTSSVETVETVETVTSSKV